MWLQHLLLPIRGLAPTYQRNTASQFGSGCGKPQHAGPRRQLKGTERRVVVDSSSCSPSHLFVSPNPTHHLLNLPQPKMAFLDEIFLVSPNSDWFRKNHFRGQHVRSTGVMASTGGCFCPARTPGKGIRRTLGQEEGTGQDFAMEQEWGLCLILRQAARAWTVRKW